MSSFDRFECQNHVEDLVRAALPKGCEVLSDGYEGDDVFTVGCAVQVSAPDVWEDRYYQFQIFEHENKKCDWENCGRYEHEVVSLGFKVLEAV